MTVELIDLHSLPIYPSSSTLRGLPPSQRTIITDRISSALVYALSLPDDKLSNFLCNDFIASYTRQEATKTLYDLIFVDGSAEARRTPTSEKVIRQRVLSLALRLADLPGAGGLSLQSILDICIVYALRNSSKVKDLVERTARSRSSLSQEVRNSVVPSFAAILLSTDSGLHALRKTAFSLKCLLQSSPPLVLDEFLWGTEFMLAFAKCYDARLSSIAVGYGGINLDRDDATETTALWVGCKVDLIDGFHFLLEHLLNLVRGDPRANTERAFDLMFSLLNLPSSPTEAPSAPRTPFLDRSLMADYQDAYGLSSTLASVLSNNDDPRLDVLEGMLKSFESDAVGNADKSGALKILLRSSGAPPPTNYRGNGGWKGKERAILAPESVPGVDLDAAVSGVLDILPDQEAGYIRALLTLPCYGGNAERVIAALLEGEAPPPSSLESAPLPEPSPTETPISKTMPLSERRNIFHEQSMEATNVQIGKRREDADAMLQDRAYLDQMKEDILRRAAELSESDEDENERAVDDVDDLDSVLDSGVKVIAGREDIEGESDDDNEEDGAGAQLPTPETLCELAYIKDPKVFDRGGDTRRSRARADLKTRTGWTDEQLEGWRIMLERNPKKDKILQKHEFTGNKKDQNFDSALNHPSTSGGPGRDSGRGRGKSGPGRGRGRGGGGRGGGGASGNDARERAWKDKNKARQANHNRKRGHDRKMARGGAIPGPSS